MLTFNRQTLSRLVTSVVVSAFVFGAAPVQAASQQQVIMGWVEYAYMPDVAGRLKAKLDTGATTSSMRAEVLKEVVTKEKDAKGKSVDVSSIVFQVEDAEGKVITMQRKLVRWVKIKNKDSTHQRRPVVEMQVCVAGRAVTSEVNLAPRADFIYPILIGRNMLRAANIIVDPARTFTSRARCPVADNDDDK